MFIAGTDTNSGKTFITLALLHKLQQQNYLVQALKPLASGTTMMPDLQYYNDDAWQLWQAANFKQDYAQINPWCCSTAIAPHIAAHQDGITLQAAQIAAFCIRQLQQPVDITLIEGAGGLLTPLNQHETYLDVLKILKIPLILVINMSLGCLNHALLSSNILQQHQLPFAGWIANTNTSTAMPFLAENIATLKQHLTAPCLGIVPYVSSPKLASNYLDAALLQVTSHVNVYNCK